MKNKYGPKDFKKNNFGNNHITIECLLSADFANQTQEEFQECLDSVPKVNGLLISRGKCDDERHYQNVKAVANLCLGMALIERRIGIVRKEG